MAKAGGKSTTDDKVSTEKASGDEEIAGLFKPKSHKTRSTDDPQVKRARQRAVHNAVKKSKAGHRAPRIMSMWEKTERRKKPNGALSLIENENNASVCLKPHRLAASSIVSQSVSGGVPYPRCWGV